MIFQGSLAIIDLSSLNLNLLSLDVILFTKTYYSFDFILCFTF